MSRDPAMTSFPADDDKDAHDDRESLSKLGQMDNWTNGHLDNSAPRIAITGSDVQPESDNNQS